MKRDPRWRGNVWNEKEIREDNDDCYEDKDKGSRIQELLILWAQTFILLSSKSKELLKRSSLDLKRKTEMENWYQHEEKNRWTGEKSENRSEVKWDMINNLIVKANKQETAGAGTRCMSLLSSSPNLFTSDIPFPWFLMLGCNSQAQDLRSHGGCRIIGPKVAKFLDR